MPDLGSHIEEMERLLRECRTYLKADKYAEYPHLIARIDTAINAGAANEDVDTGRGHTEAQDNLPVAPAPTASPSPATAKPISCALRGVGQGGVAGLAPHLARRGLTDKGYALADEDETNNSAPDAPMDWYTEVPSIKKNYLFHEWIETFKYNKSDPHAVHYNIGDMAAAWYAGQREIKAKYEF